MELVTLPVTLITGFLGSGKTTLLNRLLADGVKTAVVINEFGATPIDQDLLQSQDLPMTVLSGGCLCCQIKGALAPTLKNLWMAWNNAKSKPFERVIIEASGVASPEPLIDTILREPWLAKRYRLQHVVTTLAIPTAAEQLQRYPEAKAQAVWADSLLLTHADLADTAQADALTAELSRWAPAARLLFAPLTSSELSNLFDHARPGFRHLPNGVPVPAHEFHSLSLYLEQPPSWPELQAVLQDVLSRYRRELVRIKGVVYPPDQAEPLAVQAVAGRLYPPEPLAARDGQDRRSRLVLIVVGDAQRVADELTAALAANLDRNAIRVH